jgi:hypothetical protein
MGGGGKLSIRKLWQAYTRAVCTWVYGFIFPYIQLKTALSCILGGNFDSGENS